jgi:hypothetical protein
MTNFDIIKEVYKLAEIDESVKPWDRDDVGEERCEKIQKLIEHRRPLNFPKKKKSKRA